jgi:hypothetical protein
VKIQLTIFGIEVFCLTLGDDPLDALARAVLEAEEEESEEEAVIGGGTSHNFERDPTPLDPTDHFGEWEDKLKFGFRHPKG